MSEDKYLAWAAPQGPIRPAGRASVWFFLPDGAIRSTGRPAPHTMRPEDTTHDTQLYQPIESNLNILWH